MQDPQLDRHLKETAELKEMWQLFHEYFKIGVKGDAAVNPENESKFLEVKSRIAMLHDSMMDAVKGNAQRQVGQNIMNLVGRTITLKHINRMSDVDIKKMNLEWHESYLLLNETVGILEDRQQKLSLVNPVVFLLKRWKNRAVAAANNFLKSTAFKVMVIIAAIAGAVAAFIISGAGSFMKNNDILRPVYYGGISFYRAFINSQHPFDSIEEMLKNTRSIPEGWELLPGAGKDDRKLIEFSYGTRVGPKVGEALQKATNYEVRVYRYSPKSGAGAGLMDVNIFYLPSSSQAAEIMTEYRQWKANASAQTITNFEQDVTMGRWLNCIFIMRGGNDIMKDRAREHIFHGMERS